MLRRLFTLSPFVIVALGLFAYALYVAIRYYDDSEGWWIVVFIVSSAIAIAILVADIVTKLLLPSSKLMLIVQLVILLLYGTYKLVIGSQQILILPDNYNHAPTVENTVNNAADHRLSNHANVKNNPYVTIVYDVAGQDRLPLIFNPFKAPVTIPNDGMLLTSSSAPSHNVDKNRYILQYADGRKVGSKGTDIGYASMYAITASHNNQQYEFITFKLQPIEHCCGYSGEDQDLARRQVVNYLEDLGI